MTEEDIRWQQRFSNYKKALNQLIKAVEIQDARDLSELEKQGLIQAFEFTHELAWNVMKDFFVYQGNSFISGSRDASREAYKNGIIKDGETWLDMIKSRNKSSHTYNEEIAEEIVELISKDYLPLFLKFKEEMERRLIYK